MTIYEFAEQIIYEAGQNIKNKLALELTIETKSNPNDLVTNMDKETEQLLVERINQAYPDHHIIGEEGHGKEVDTLDGVVWIIDPIDGTLNFVHQQQNFAISIGIFKDGEKYAGLVYDVMNDNLYHAIAGEGAYLNDMKLGALADTTLKRSIISLNPNWLTKDWIKDVYTPIVKDARSARSYGSAALDFVFVAVGIVDSYMTLRLHPWDFAGGMIIAEETGAVVSNQMGETLHPLQSNSIIVANQQLHREIVSGYLSRYEKELTELHQGMFSSR
ncbi:inositol monophosphatase family protein [Macrococcus equipercicus]|uniref:inositol-phosphate phosphatase n=1 Tax=Macrococcus equipercicus TaxID=69967 RepID=A0A9Q9BXQ2_9STAP|nr:inositol monophosphatase family protein [Macrococcus equipercicus]UTH14542.1 inositol monophosphatase family protein [Macrococcus equipercicus]